MAHTQGGPAAIDKSRIRFLFNARNWAASGNGNCLGVVSRLGYYRAAWFRFSLETAPRIACCWPISPGGGVQVHPNPCSSYIRSRPTDTPTNGFLFQSGSGRLAPTREVDSRPAP